MNKKGRKTTMISYAMIVLGISVFIMWWLDKIETSELMIALIAINYLSGMVIGKLAKDASASHTFDTKSDDTVNPIPPPPPNPPGDK